MTVFCHGPWSRLGRVSRQCAHMQHRFGSTRLPEQSRYWRARAQRRRPLDHSSSSTSIRLSIRALPSSSPSSPPSPCTSHTIASPSLKRLPSCPIDLNSPGLRFLRGLGFSAWLFHVSNFMLGWQGELSRYHQLRHPRCPSPLIPAPLIAYQQTQVELR